MGLKRIKKGKSRFDKLLDVLKEKNVITISDIDKVKQKKKAVK